MKYKFTKINDDIIELSYKDKKFDIKKDVESLIKSQDVYNQARTKMLIDLAKKGVSIEDLKIKKEQDGKVLVDESSLQELENLYINEEQRLLFNNASQKYFNMSINELVLDIGLEENEAEEFGRQLAMAMAGSVEETPSKEKSNK